MKEKKKPLLLRERCLAVVLLALLAACDESLPNGPSPAALVTFRVQNESFRVLLTSSEQVDAARAAQSGGPERIPVGRIVQGTQVNTGWNWHLDQITFAFATIEVCDGLPSHVEREGTNFGARKDSF